MASAFEQESIRKKANENKSFFQDMEANIHRMMRGDPPLPSKNNNNNNNNNNTNNSNNNNNNTSNSNAKPMPMRRENSSEFNRMGLYDTEIPRRYRTISSIDDEVVELMKYTYIEENRHTHRSGSIGSRSGSSGSIGGGIGGNGTNSSGNTNTSNNTGYHSNNIDDEYDYNTNNNNSNIVTRSRKGSEELITTGVRRGSLKLCLNETPLPLYLSPPILAVSRLLYIVYSM